jgi:hypothetical protein
MIKRNKKIVVLLMIYTLSLFAAPTVKKTLVAGLNANQISFTNWTKGGEDAFSWTIRLDGSYEKKDSSFVFDLDTKFAFGQTKVDQEPFKKSIDEIRISVVYSRNYGIYVNPFVSTLIETQMAPGFQYSETEGDKIVSKFFDPGYVTESFGLGISPLPQLKARLGFAFKQTFTSKYPVPYADDPNTPKTEKIKYEKGGQFSMDIKWQINKTVMYKSTTNVFSNMEWIREVDVRMSHFIVSKITKILNINFEYNILYDRDQSKKIQIRQAFALGINFNLL